MIPADLQPHIAALKPHLRPYAVHYIEAHVTDPLYSERMGSTALLIDATIYAQVMVHERLDPDEMLDTRNAQADPNSDEWGNR